MDNTFKPSKNIVEIERFQYTVVTLFKYFDMLTIASQVNICKDIIFITLPPNLTLFIEITSSHEINISI